MPRIYRSYNCEILLKRLDVYIPEINKSFKNIKVSIWGNNPRMLNSIIRNLEDYLSGDYYPYTQTVMYNNTLYTSIRSSASYKEIRCFSFSTAKYKARNAIASSLNKEFKIAKDKARGNRKRITELNKLHKDVMFSLHVWWNNMDTYIRYDTCIYLNDVIELLNTDKDIRVLRKSLVPGLQSFRWNKDTTLKILDGLPNSKDRFFESPHTGVLKNLVKMKRKYGNVPIRK